MAQSGDLNADASGAEPAARGPADPVSATERARRLEALASLVPPLAHKLNNALGGAVGLADLVRMRTAGGGAMGAGGVDLLAAAQAEAATALELVSGLGRFARDVSTRPQNVDLHALLGRVEALITPLAQAHGVRVERRAASGPLTAQVRDGGLEHWMLVAAAELLGPAPSPGAPAGPLRGGRLCLAASAGPTPRVRLVAAGPRGGAWVSDGPAPPPWEREQERGGLRRRVRELEPAPQSRSSGPDVLRPRPPLAAPHPAAPRAAQQRGARLALLERDEALAELIGMVLGEAGHGVQRCREAGELMAAHTSGEADWALVAGGGLDAAGLEQLGLAADAGLPVAFLGAARGSRLPAALASASTLPKPFRPADLLDFVAGLLSAGDTRAAASSLGRPGERGDVS